MGRLKLARVIDLEKGVTRLSAVKSIDENLDLGNDITLANYEVEISKTQAKLSEYNTALSKIDDLYNLYNAQVAILKDWNERILTGVATKYGKNSSEYEMAGGVRKSERKKSKTAEN